MVLGIPCLAKTDFIAEMTDADVVDVNLMTPGYREK